MNRELYIYWRVPPAQLSQTLQVCKTFQAKLQQQHAGLTTRLLVRGDEAAGGHATLMEIYSRPGGIDDDLQDQIEALAAEQFSVFTPVPKRHIEAFVPARP